MACASARRTPDDSPLTALDQLAGGMPILYRVDEEAVEEFPDGSRYVVELLDGGRATRRVREF